MKIESISSEAMARWTSKRSIILGLIYPFLIAIFSRLFHHFDYQTLFTEYKIHIVIFSIVLCALSYYFRYLIRNGKFPYIILSITWLYCFINVIYGLFISHENQILNNIMTCFSLIVFFISFIITCFLLVKFLILWNKGQVNLSKTYNLLYYGGYLFIENMFLLIAFYSQFTNFNDL